MFSAPFHNFLREEDEVREGDEVPGKISDWYNGVWTDFHDSRWRMHNFFVPINNQNVTKPKVREGGQAAIAERLDDEEDEGMMRYKVWGMTARMLVDAARVAYGEEPEFEVCSPHFMVAITHFFFRGASSQIRNNENLPLLHSLDGHQHTSCGDEGELTNLSIIPTLETSS